MSGYVDPRQVPKGIGLDTLHDLALGAIQGATTGALGGPADLYNMGTAALGLKPLPGGSEWWRDRLQGAGIYGPRSGSAAETVGELAGGLAAPGPDAVQISHAMGIGLPLLAGILRRADDSSELVRYNKALPGAEGKVDDLGQHTSGKDSGGPQTDGGLAAQPAEGSSVGSVLRDPASILDPEGRDLSGSRHIVGQGPSGPEVPLDAMDATGIADRLAGLQHVPRSKLKGDLGRVTFDADGNPKMELANDLNSLSYKKTLFHELGHVGGGRAYVAGKFNALSKADQAALDRELRRSSREIREGFWSRHSTPKAVGDGIGYVDTLPELHADAQAAYSSNPVDFKKKYPRAAAFVRDVWNSTPKLRDEIGFNLLPLGIGLGVGAAALDQGSTD